VELTGLSKAEVLGSRYELMRVVQNLVKNAIESGASSIQVGVERLGGQVRLVVRDNGPGMGPAEIKKALGGGYTTKANGTGLGLSICRHIIATHGGELVLQSVQQIGTECSIHLPILN
jgi:signal transduction histidine kinase